MKLTIEKKNAIFKSLATKPLYDVGLDFGFDKHYKDSKAVKGGVYRVYQQVKNSPEEFGIQQQTYDLVVGAVSSRQVAKRPRDEVSLREKTEALDSLEVKDLVVGLRNKALKLAHRKMDLIGKTNKTLDGANLATIMNAVGISFDKAQIIQGQATEHVAMQATIDKNLKPEEAIQVLLQMREKTQEEHDRRSNKKK